LSWNEATAYLGVFAALVAAGLGFPIPEEIPIVAGGVLAGQADHEPFPRREEVIGLLACDPQAGLPGAVPWGALDQMQSARSQLRVRWWVMLPICILGVVLSDGLLYGIGRLFGARLLRSRWFARMLGPQKREKIQRNFHQYGVKILLFARLMPGIRAPIFITAGLMHLPLRRFLLADGIYAIPGVSLLFFLSYWFTTSFQDLVMWAEVRVVRVGRLITLLLIAGVVVYLIYNFFRYPSPTGDPEELPIVGHQVASRLSGEFKKPPRGAGSQIIVSPSSGPGDGNEKKDQEKG
jgi:membrane protein DedA with SNARE-associated domain